MRFTLDEAVAVADSLQDEAFCAVVEEPGDVPKHSISKVKD
jgi:hypothetical protein